MSAKALIKSARDALSQNDPDEAIDLCNDVISLNEEKFLYYAFVFKAKAHHLKKQLDKATQCYFRAVEIDPDDILAWKGLVLIARDNTDYRLFFRVIGGECKVLRESGEPIVDILKEIDLYVKKFSRNGGAEFDEVHLRSLLPHTTLGEFAGPFLPAPEITLSKIIRIVQPREKREMESEVDKVKRSFPMNPTSEQQEQLAVIRWRFYTNSEIPGLYEQLIQFCQDDDLRRFNEGEYLAYKYEVLNNAPSEEKPKLTEEIYEMTSNMVLVDHDSRLAWVLYLDLCDPAVLGDLELKSVCKFITKFGIEGLGGVLYAFVYSEISPFDEKKVSELLKSDDKHSDETAVKLPKAALSSDDVLSLMLRGIDKEPDSLLASRVVILYYIHLKEYLSASERCRYAISKMARFRKNTSFSLPNTKRSLILSLAIVYTYHESPKNFSRALELYDSVLKESDNVSAQVGKGLILIEKNQLIEAENLLTDVVEGYPGNLAALEELSWCQVKLGKHQVGRDGLKKCFDGINGSDFSSGEARAAILWRIGESYISEIDPADADAVLVKCAYDTLINSLKESRNFASPYTSLGFIYANYMDDPKRSTKCYYKAIELDASEIKAAYALVKQFSHSREWEMVTILSKRVISSERAVRLLPSTSDPAWPHRMLGCAALESQKDAEAVEHFQTALRLSPSDIQCWIGMGEAYFGCGRIEASIKVFNHALKLDPSNWNALFMLAEAQKAISEHSSAIANLEKLLSSRPNELCVLKSLFEAHVMLAESQAANGFTYRSVESASNALKVIAITPDKQSQKLWKCLIDVLDIFLFTQKHLDVLDFATVSEILSTSTYDAEEVDPSLNEVSILQMWNSNERTKAVKVAKVKSAICALSNLPTKSTKPLRASLFFNLGLAYYGAGSTRYASKCLKKAVSLEPSLPEYWSLLGASTNNPRLSQHCFIKASSLSSRDPLLWNNLGCLYLKNEDPELAREAFMRAQSMAPEQNEFWTGQALTADALERPSTNLYTHAYSLSNNRSPLTQLLYGLSVLGRTFGASESDLGAIQEISVANFAVLSYLKHYPKDRLALSVSLDFLERTNNFELGVTLCTGLCEMLEELYEQNSTDDTLSFVVRAKAQLARLLLGSSKYHESLEAAQFTLDVLEDDDENLRLSCLAVIGLSHFFLKDFNQALLQLKQIVQVSSSSERMVVLIAQILYAYGNEESKQAALDELFQSIDENGSSLLVALTLAALSLVENLEDYIPAILEELEGLPIDVLIQDKSRSVPHLISEMAKTLGSVSQKGYQRCAFLFPSDFKLWSNLDFCVALQVASKTALVSSADLSNSYFASKDRRNIQRGLFLTPSSEFGFKCLTGCFD